MESTPIRQVFIKNLEFFFYIWKKTQYCIVYNNLLGKGTKIVHNQGICLLPTSATQMLPQTDRQHDNKDITVSVSGMYTNTTTWMKPFFSRGQLGKTKASAVSVWACVQLLRAQWDALSHTDFMSLCLSLWLMNWTWNQTCVCVCVRPAWERQTEWKCPARGRVIHQSLLQPLFQTPKTHTVKLNAYRSFSYLLRIILS